MFRIKLRFCYKGCMQIRACCVHLECLFCCLFDRQWTAPHPPLALCRPIHMSRFINITLCARQTLGFWGDPLSCVHAHVPWTYTQCFTISLYTVNGRIQTVSLCLISFSLCVSLRYQCCFSSGQTEPWCRGAGDEAQSTVSLHRYMSPRPVLRKCCCGDITLQTIQRLFKGYPQNMFEWVKTIRFLF